MDLQELVFKVNTDQLKSAVKDLQDLGKAVSTLKSDVSNLKKSSEGLADTPLMKPPKGDPIEKSIEKPVRKATKSVEELKEELRITQKDLADGFTRGESSILKLARGLNATEDQMQEVKGILQEIGRLFKDPFDSAIGSIRSITAEFDALNTRSTLAAQGIFLNTKQLREFSRISDEVKAKQYAAGVSGADGSIFQIAAIEKVQQEYLQLSQEVNKLDLAEKDRLSTLKEQQKIEARIFAENMKMGDAMVTEFRKNEEQKQAALLKTQQIIQEINQKAALMNSGYSSGEASTIVSLKGQGLDDGSINNVIAASRAASEAARKAATDRAEATRKTHQMADANQYLIDLEKRLKLQLEATNLELKERHTNQLNKINKQIELSGMSAEQAAVKMAKLDGLVRSVASKERQNELRQLSRAMSVQMGDVAISLASGMNPLLVMIQQGDQIRGVLEQTNAKGKELQLAMQTAASQIAAGFINTGKAIGGFFVGSIQSAGEAIGAFAVKSLGLTTAVEGIAKELDKGAKSGAMLSLVLQGATKVAIFTIGAVALSAAVSLGLLAGAFVSIIKEQDSLARSLALTNGAMGLTKETTAQYVEGLSAIGINSGKAIQVIQEMGKASNLTADEILTVTKSAVDLEKYGGVAIEETVKKFSQLKKDPVDALMSLARETGNVSLATVQLVDDLVRQGESFRAQQIAVSEFARVNKEAIKNMKEDYSDLGLSLIAMMDKFKGYYDAMKSLLRAASPAAMLDKEIEQVSSVLSMKALLPDSVVEKQEQLLKNLMKQRIVLEATGILNEQRAKDSAEALRLEELNRKYRESSMTKEQSFRAEKLKIEKQIAEAEDLRSKGVNVNTDGMYAALAKNAKDYAKDLAAAAKASAQLSDADKERERVSKEADQVLVRINKELNKNVQVQEELTNAQRLANDIYADPDYKNYPETLKQIINLKLNELYQTELLAVKEEQLRKQRKKAYDEYVSIIADRDKFTFDFLESQDKTIASLNEEAELIQYQTTILAESSQERSRLIKLKQSDLLLTKELAEIEKNKSKFSDSEAMANAIVNAYDAAKKRVYNINSEFSMNLKDNLLDDVSNAIETGLFEGGKAGKKKLRDIIVAELKKPITLTIRAVVDTILSGGSEKSKEGLVQKVTDGVKKFTDVLSGRSGDKFGADITKAMNSLGGDFAKYSAEIGKAAGMLGNVMIGYELSKTISDGYEVNKFVNKIGAAASAYFGPIAGIISGAINRLFGRKLKDVGVQGTFGGDEGFSGSTYKYYKGGLLRSDKTKTKDLDSSVESSLGLQFKALKDSTKAMAAVLGLGSESIDNFSKSIKFSTKGMTSEQIQARFEEEFALLNDEMAAQVLGSARTITENIVQTVEDVFVDEAGNLSRLSYRIVKAVSTDIAGSGVDYSKAGETASVTLERLANSLFTVNSAFKDLGFALKEVSLAGADASSKFIDFFGSLEAAQTSMGLYYENFYSEEERVAKTTQKLTDALALLGVSMPTDREAYRALVDQAAAAGNDEMLAGLIKLSAVYAELNPLVEEAEEVIDEISDTMKNLIKEGKELEIEIMKLQGNSEEAKIAMRALAIEGMTASEVAAWDYNESLRDQISVLELAAEAAEELKNAWQSATDSIFQEIERIRGLSGDPTMSLSKAQSEFDSAIIAANGGDVNAAKSLPGLSQTLLELAGQQATSLIELRRIEALTANALETAAYGYVGQYGLTVPQFAEGGSYSGGLALVGEQGPELINFSSPGQVSNASSTARMMDNTDLVNEIRSLKTELTMLRAEVRADVSHNAKTAKLLDRAMRDGESFQVTVLP